MRGLGIRSDAHLILDRETGVTYALHNGACADRFEAAMSGAGVDTLARFVPMGPTILRTDETCNLSSCDRA